MGEYQIRYLPDFTENYARVLTSLYAFYDVDYIENFETELLYRKIPSLMTFPNGNPKYFRNEEYRRIVFRKHIIFYTVDETQKTVFIENIKNGIMNFDMNKDSQS
jgi:hypothetical protein